MRTITAIALIAIAAMFVAPDSKAPQRILTREDKIRILCGQNASHIDTGKLGEVQCVTKHGRKTKIKGVI